MKFFCKRRLPATLLVLSAGIIFYSNTFQVPFVLDDVDSISRNDIIRSLGNFYANRSGYEFLPNRYIAYLTFALNYHFGGLDLFGYHAVNLAIHLVSSLLVYTLLRLTFRTPFFQGREERAGSGLDPTSTFYASHLTPHAFIPLFAALIFVAHPVQTQAVTYVVQRITSLATLFYLLSLVLYVAARLRFESRVPSPGSRDSKDLRTETFDLGPGTSDSGLWTRTAPVLLLAGSVLSAVLAMKTKEISFTLPLAIVLYEVCFFRGAWKRRLPCLLPLLATLPIVPATIIDISGGSESGILSYTGETGLSLGEQFRVDTGISRLDYLFTQFRVVVTYLRLLIFPANQNLDYDYPVYTTFFSPPVFLSFLLLAALLGLAGYLFWRTRYSRIKQVENGSGSEEKPFPQPQPGFSSTFLPNLRLVSFGILWFFLTLSVESTFIPIVDVIVEHRLYLPGFGAAVVLSTFLCLVGEKIARPSAQQLLGLTAVTLVVALGFATYQRNHVWRDPVRLWEDIVSKSPGKARVYNNLGAVLTEAGRMPEAIESLMRGIALDPSHPDAYYNLGRVYYLIDRNLEAVPLLKKAIGMDLYYSEAYITLAASLNQLKRFRETVVLLEQNLDRIGERVETHYHLGVAYAFLGERQAAREKLAIVSPRDAVLAEDLMRLLK
jgi:hypothetical protein